MMKVKVIFGNDIRRWRYPQSKKYQNLLEFVKQTFNFLDERQFYVQFEDDEGDRLTITSETDFEDAFSCAEQEERKSLKIFVIKGSIEDSHNNSSSQAQPNDEKEQSPVQPKSSSNNHEAHCDEKSEEFEKDKSNCNYNCCGSPECCQMLLDFLQNKEIQPLLPQLVLRIVSALRKEQQQTSNQKTVLQIINEILGENQFKPIVQHELFTKKIACMLPFVAQKIQSHQHFLFAFNEDAIASWVPHLINTGINILSNFKNVNVEVDVDPMLNQFFPFLGSMNFHSNFSHCFENNNSNNCCDSNQEKIHDSVTCDNCQCCPIIGARYKCCVCSNYDLCSKCEALGKHDQTHPLLKITCPTDNYGRRHYNGLHEFLRWSRQRCHRFDHRRQHSSPHCHRRRCPFFNNLNQNCSFANGAPNFCAFSNSCNEKNKTNETESKLNEKRDIICQCGEMLVAIPACQAYNGSRAYCNICNKQFQSDETIYHCQQDSNVAHAGGFDLCQNCADIQMQSMISSINVNKDQKKNESEIKNINVENENKSDDDFVPIVQPNVANVNEIENNQNRKISEPELIEMEDINDNDNNKEKDDKFEFKSQLNSLQEMGFYDIDSLKLLLIKHKGDIQRVIQELLQA